MSTIIPRESECTLWISTGRSSYTRIYTCIDTTVSAWSLLITKHEGYGGITTDVIGNSQNCHRLTANTDRSHSQHLPRWINSMRNEWDWLSEPIPWRRRNWFGEDTSSKFQPSTGQDSGTNGGIRTWRKPAAFYSINEGFYLSISGPCML